MQPLRLDDHRVPVDDRAGGLPGADGLHQRDRSLQCDDGRADVGTALEPRRRLGLQSQPLARAANRGRLEARALEHDRAGGAGHLGCRAAHDAGHRLRAIAVGDDEHVRFELAIDAVERPDGFTLRRAPHADGPAGERVEVEGVHRLAQFEQHVVRHVDDGTDRTHAGRLQARRHPRRRHGAGAADARDICDSGRIPRAQLCVLDRDVDSIGLSGGNGCPRGGWRRRERRGIRRRHLARQPDHAEAVRPVGRDLEVDHRVAGVQRFDGRNLEAAQPERLGDLFRSRLHVDKITEPGNDEPHLLPAPADHEDTKNTKVTT